MDLKKTSVKNKCYAALVAMLSICNVACDNPCGQRLSTDPTKEEYMKLLDGVADLVGAPAAMVTILAPGQEEPWVGVSGCLDLEAQTPMALDASMRMASVSKLLNSILFMSLTEGGELSLDDPITIEAPGYTTSPTARDLLLMTSGVPDYLTDAFWQSFAQDPTRVRTRDELIAFGLDEPALGTPGQQWSYSNTNHLLLEAHIQTRTGRSLQEHLDALQGGTAPSLVYTHLSSPMPPFAGAATQSCLRAMCRVQGQEGDFHPSVFGAAGSLAGKPPEMAALTRNMLYEGGLSPESITAMTQWRDVEGEEHQQVGSQYGLGLYKLNTSSGLWWGHPGLGLGDSALLAVHAESGAVVLVTASQALGQTLTEHVIQHILPVVTP